MGSARLVATVWSVAFIAFLWGFAAQRYQLFPYTMLSPTYRYVESFPEDTSTLWGKILSDMNIKPERLIRHFRPLEGTQYTHLNIEGLNPRRGAPRIRLHDAQPAFRLLVGAFDFKDAFWGAVLIDETGALVHTWKLSGEIPELNALPDVNKGIYGVAVLPDGSIIFNMDASSRALIKRDFCSALSWFSRGSYHHTASPSEDFSTFWTFSGLAEDAWPVLAQLDSATGKVLRTIDTRDIQKQNPDLFIFDLRSLDRLHFLSGQKDTNYPHHNDIKPLPSADSAAFPQFTPGDLAINYRTSNLFYVMNPDTLKVSFWYAGAQDGGHDVDWQSDGTLSLLNNKWRAGWDSLVEEYATIVSIDPVARSHRVILDGKPYNIRTSINGRHQITPRGSILITSAMQGRFIEINRVSGEVIFEFLNDYDKAQQETLHVSEAFYLPKDFFTRDVYDKHACAPK